MHLLLTGAAGYLGRHLAPLLAADGFGVTGIDLAPAPDPLPDGLARYIQGDLGDAELLADVLDGVELVIHCASIHPWKPYPDSLYIDANIRGTWVLYQALAAAGIRRVVLTSSIAAVNPAWEPAHWPVDEALQSDSPGIYGFTKQSQETTARLFAASHGIRSIALRPPAFMPRPALETGFNLTGCFSTGAEMARAHAAAARVLAGRQQPAGPIGDYEAIYVTNALPYTAADVAACSAPDGALDRLALVRRHWPDAADWLAARDFQPGWLPAVYDLRKADRLLDWRPELNFPQWFAAHRDQL